MERKIKEIQRVNMEQITNYFNAEKSESILFILVGSIAIGIALYFLFKLKEPFYNGIAYPLIAVALIQIVVGTSIFFRSPKDIERVSLIIQTEKSRIQTEEIPRMEVVMKNFEMYRWVEISLLILGIVFILFFHQQSIWKGVGLGLSIQAGFMLLLDFFAESRGSEYLDFLRTML